MLRLPAEQVPYYDRGAIGYILHSYYNGCENIFNSIARFFLKTTLDLSHGIKIYSNE